ncbi:MAG TPA: nuclear transport factor 2 family protein [Candidatus Binataceae bacterium]|nr:nuclear transport factor 2 family protein [Candidatus Binataceae bacterium]
MDSSRINELYDRFLITDVIYRYSTGADNKDWQLFRSCFTDPVNADFTSTGAPAPRTFPLDTWVRVVQKTLTPFKMTQHCNSNVKINFSGDEATAVVYLRARHLRADDQGDNKFWDVGGYYTDRLVRTPDGWKIATVKFTQTWSEGQP